jgi:hypothetical protein
MWYQLQHAGLLPIHQQRKEVQAAGAWLLLHFFRDAAMMLILLGLFKNHDYRVEHSRRDYLLQMRHLEEEEVS